MGQKDRLIGIFGCIHKYICSICVCDPSKVLDTLRMTIAHGRGKIIKLLNTTKYLDLVAYNIKYANIYIPSTICVIRGFLRYSKVFCMEIWKLGFIYSEIY